MSTMKTHANMLSALADRPLNLRGKPNPRDKFAGAKRSSWAFNRKHAAPSVCVIIKH